MWALNICQEGVAALPDHELGKQGVQGHPGSQGPRRARGTLSWTIFELIDWLIYTLINMLICFSYTLIFLNHTF